MSAIAARKAQRAAAAELERNSRQSSHDVVSQPGAAHSADDRAHDLNAVEVHTSSPTAIVGKRDKVKSIKSSAARKARKLHASLEGSDAGVLASAPRIDSEDVRALETGPSQPSWWTPKWKSESNLDFDAFHERTSSSAGSSDITKEKFILRIPQGECMSLVGAAMLRVLHGSLFVNGLELQPGTSEMLLCPLTDPLPILRGGAGLGSEVQRDAASDLFDKGTSGSTVLLEPLGDLGLEDLSGVCAIAGQDPFCAVVPAGQSYQNDLGSRHISFLKLITRAEAESGGYTFFRSSPSWDLEYSHLAQRFSEVAQGNVAQVFLTRGPKGAGKSTFGRSVLNTLLGARAKSGVRPKDLRCRDVAYLDLDLGQGEFGVPGTVALYRFSNGKGHQLPLISPSWLSSLGILPVKSYYLGQTTPRDIPTLYLDSVEKLVASYNAQMRGEGVPLVVNTMGWNKGLGTELNARIEQLIQPHRIYDLFALQDPWSPLPALPEPWTAAPYCDGFGRVVAPGARVIPLQAMGMDALRETTTGEGTNTTEATSRRKALTAADQRSLSVMTHLHYWSTACADGVPRPRWVFSTSLIHRPPFVVDVARALRGGIHMIPQSATPAHDVHQTMASLNGEIVGLALVSAADDAVEPNGTTANAQDDVLTSMAAWRSAMQRPLLSNKSDVDLICLALVRSIDTEAGELHLVCSPDALTRLWEEEEEDDNDRHDEAPLPSTARPARSRRQLALLKAADPCGSGATNGSSTLVDTPVWAFLDRHSIRKALRGRLGVSGAVASAAAAAQADDSLTMCGVSFDALPYLQWPEAAHEGSESVIGGEKRRIRRNLMRKGQQ